MHAVAFILTMVGGVNWLLVGLLEKDIFSLISLEGTIPRIVYLLVGLSALYLIFTHKKDCKMCDKGTSGAAPMGGNRPV